MKFKEKKLQLFGYIKWLLNMIIKLLNKLLNNELY